MTGPTPSKPRLKKAQKTSFDIKYVIFSAVMGEAFGHSSADALLSYNTATACAFVLKANLDKTMLARPRKRQSRRTEYSLSENDGLSMDPCILPAKR